jgi:hypothetical protein
MPHLEQITLAPGLTFDALTAGKPGAPLVCCCTMRRLPPERAAAAIAAFTSADWGGGIGWAPAMPSPLHGQLTNFLILFHYCDG